MLKFMSMCPLALMLFIATATGRVHATEFDVLLFTKTAGWHHKSQHKAVEAIQNLAKKHFFSVEWHEDANIFNSKDLARFDAVIFLSTTGDVLNGRQQQQLTDFIRAGNGFVGIHSASDTEKSWPWYQQLVGHTFVIHPPVQTAQIRILDADFPGMHGFTDGQIWTDEWYEFSPPHVSDLNYLITVDESTYNTKADWGNVTGNGMGAFHPIAWYHYFEGGRSFYTSLGHMSGTYQIEAFQWHMAGGIYWAATGKGIREENQFRN
ncbi:ThuA domain-containing protein [Aestuariibacter sp. A3R04]|uniref:ThuA domain-containing protein n=1 Tax=Aestuariibacter sp. A3R04 TaxID=2841571 RepID=UPI001C08B64E|nr:ThuA domain-containing protein [Aestuariibacter sp. A3R04]MBU3020728.1 ThuA domain-containing protein [Aestuariibacter sp. A3R04]